MRMPSDAMESTKDERIQISSRIVPHLASHVLGLALRRLQEDFRQRYGYEPLLVETFIEQQRFAGTCYRAATFIEVGRTQGRGWQDRSHRGGSSVKRVFVYALHKQARQRLCAGELSGQRARRPRHWCPRQRCHGIGRQRNSAMRFALVTLQAPKIKARYGPLKLWAVLAEEVDAPGDVEPMSWMLLTSCPV